MLLVVIVLDICIAIVNYICYYLVVDRRFYGAFFIMAAQRQNVFEAVLARQVLANGNDNGVAEGEIALLLDAYHLDFEDMVDSDSDTSAETDSESEDEDADRPTVVVDGAVDDRRLAQQVESNVAERADTDIMRAEAFSCRCLSFEGGPCCRQFSSQEIADSRLNMKEMTEGRCLTWLWLCLCLWLSMTMTCVGVGVGVGVCVYTF